MSTLINDIKYGIRQLIKSPGFTLVTVLTLALSIGANTVIFSLIHAILLRPLSFDEPDKLVMVWQTDKARGNYRHTVSYPNIEDWRRDNQVFEDLSVIQRSSKIFCGEGDPKKIATAAVSASFFSLLRVNPFMGRTFTLDDEETKGDQIAILSHAFWKGQCHSDSEIIGKPIRLDQSALIVVGVMPPLSFPGEILGEAELWTPLNDRKSMFSNRGAHFLNVLARLKKDVSLAEAQAHMNTIASRLERAYEDNENMGINVSTLHRDSVLNVRLALWVLFGAVGFVLLIACANITTLLMMRAGNRTREFAIRTAMGGSRGCLIQQTLTESLILSLLSGGVALLVAYWGIDLVKTIVPGSLPRMHEIGLSAHVIGFVVLVSMGTTVLSGLLPALKASIVQPYRTLRTSTHDTIESGRSRIQNALIVGEIGIALVLLIGATLLMRSFWDLTHVDTGFQSEKILTWQVSLPGHLYRQREEKQGLYRQFIERLQALPSVLAVGATSTLPFADDIGVGAKRLHGPSDTTGEFFGTRYNSVTPYYFRAMGIPLQKGRFFTETDHQVGQTGTVIINETLARTHFSHEDPLGQRIYCGLRTSKNDPDAYEIVGVVSDIKQQGFDSQVRAEIFLPTQQQAVGVMTFVARIQENPLALANTVRALARKLDTNIVVDRFKTMNQWKSESVAQRRFVMTLIALFACLALTLTLVGVYGVVAYSTSRRTHEIGMRMALGAQAQDVMRMILRNGIKLGFLGVTLGILGAIVLSRYLKSMLFELSATDPMTYGMVTILLLGVVLLASYFPARRAAKIDPMEALRYE